MTYPPTRFGPQAEPLSYEDLLKVYQELDDNSKILVQTDLELHKTKNELESRINQLVLLNRLSDLIHASQEKQTILKTVCELLVSGNGFEKAWVLYYVGENPEPHFVQVGVSSGEQLRLLQIAQGSKKAPSDVPLLCTLQDPHPDVALQDVLAALQSAQVIYVPLSGGNHKTEGIFAARLHAYPPVTVNDQRFMTMLSRQVAIALDNAKMHEEITANNTALEERVALRSKELMEANTHLLELDRAKSNFISLVSHELRTPMTAIKGFASLLLEFEDRVKPEQRRDYLRKIGIESDRLSRLIGDLLNISRIESGRMDLRWSKVDLASLVEAVFEKQRVHKHPVEYRSEIDPSVPSFAADPDKVHQVLLNLVANAARFTPPGGTVTVSADRFEEGIRLRVTNPGEGIPFEQLPKVFDKFYRLENDVNRKNPGTGLGLSICRALVDLHGGKIWADSELHKQTTFTVLLPLNLDKSNHLAREASLKPAA